MNDFVRNVELRTSCIHPVLVPKRHKWLTPHHKLLYSLPHSLSPCSLAQNPHKKLLPILCDEIPDDLLQDYDTLSLCASSHIGGFFFFLYLFLCLCQTCSPLRSFALGLCLEVLTHALLLVIQAPP